MAGANINKLFLLAAISAAIFTLQTTSALAFDFGFESASFSGWNLVMPTGQSSFQGTVPAGSASIASTWGPNNGMSGPVLPQEGNFFAILGTAPHAYFSGAQNYDITLSQSFTLGRGDQLSGWASFYNGDDAPQDSAWVKVLDASNNELGTLWDVTSGGPNNNPPFESVTDWTLWQWQAPAAGTYTLKLGMSTQGDDNLASYAFYDRISIMPNTVVPVPEPSEMLFIGLGAICLAVFNRKSRE